MIRRLRGLGIVLGLIGIAFVAAGAFAFMKKADPEGPATPARGPGPFSE